MEKKKDSFILYEEYYEPIKMLSTADKGMLLAALYEYHMNGDVIELPQMAKVIFQFIKRRMDINNKKYAEACEKNRENVRKRWNKEDTKGYETIRPNTTVCENIPKIRPNTNYTDMDTDIDIDMDKPPIPPLNVDKSVDNSQKRKEGRKV